MCCLLTRVNRLLHPYTRALVQCRGHHSRQGLLCGGEVGPCIDSGPCSRTDASSFIGVILVTHSDSTVQRNLVNAADMPTHPVLGDLASLLSALFYSIYVILLKVRLGDESKADTQLMLG